MRESEIKLDDFFGEDPEGGSEKPPGSTGSNSPEQKSSDFFLGVNDAAVPPDPAEAVIGTDADKTVVRADNPLVSPEATPAPEAAIPETMDLDGDFRSIGDLIDEELDATPDPTAQHLNRNDSRIEREKSPTRSGGLSGVTKTGLPNLAQYDRTTVTSPGAKGDDRTSATAPLEMTNVSPIAPIAPLVVPEANLGEAFQAVQQSVDIFNQVAQLIAQYGGADSPALGSADMISALKQNQNQLREQQSILQGLVSNYIRQNDFERLGAVDKIKRRLDDLLLQIRAVLNRYGGDQTAVLSEAEIAVKMQAAGHMPLEQEDDLTKFYRSAKQKERGHETRATTATATAFRSKADSRMPGFFSTPAFKLIIVSCIFLMTIPAYYMSKNYGVQKVTKVDPEIYAAILPLESASSSGNVFHGVVSESWRHIDKKEREQALKDLAQAVKDDGYQTIFLVYSNRGMAAVYNLKSGKIHVQ